MHMIKHQYWASIVVLSSLLFLSLSLARAEEVKKPTSTKAGQGEGPDAIPTYSGKGKVTEAVDSQRGAIFDIGGGVTMTFPRGLPVGRSRLVTLKTTTDRPTPAHIHPKFQRVGATLHFNGALNSGRVPMVLSVSAKRSPEKAGYKLVLAIEEAGICTKDSKGAKLGQGLCSSWRTIDARYDTQAGKINADLASTGGYRLQFGLVPSD
jgi:hypothetical protein